MIKMKPTYFQFFAAHLPSFLHSPLASIYNHNHAMELFYLYKEYNDNKISPSQLMDELIIAYHEHMYDSSRKILHDTFS